MFLIAPNTPIQVFAPFNVVNGSVVNDKGEVDEFPWKRRLTKKEMLLDKEDVWDRVAVENNRSDVPEWAAHTVKVCFTVIRQRNGKGDYVYARVKPNHLQYVD